MPTYLEFAQKIKQKYPDYKDQDDKALAEAFIKKYPDYKDQITFDSPKQPFAGDQEKEQAYQQFKNFLFGQGQMGSPLSKAGVVASGLEGIAKVGRKATEGLGVAGALVGPKTERAARAVGEVLLPQNKLTAGMAIAGGLAGKGATKAISTDRVRVAQPNLAERAAGGMISVTTRVPERLSSAVVADTSILDKTVTPGLKQVSQEMGQYFKSKGLKLNSEKMQELFQQDYVPNDNQVAKLNKMVDKVLNKLRSSDPKIVSSVTEEELVFAERAANGLIRSTGAQTNKYLLKKAQGAQKFLLDQLEQHGFKELPGLKAKYFRALAQDAFEDFLPRNKTGGPNALSGLLMGKQVLGAGADLLQGNVPGAVGKAATGAAFSPMLVGNALKTASSVAKSPSTQRAGAQLGIAALNQLNKKKEKK